jgi:hypothetical protein
MSGVAPRPRSRMATGWGRAKALTISGVCCERRGVPLGARGVVCPAWALTRRWKSSGDLVAGTQANRKVLVREGGAEGSGEQTREPTNRDRRRGGRA